MPAPEGGDRGREGGEEVRCVCVLACLSVYVSVCMYEEHKVATSHIPTDPLIIQCISGRVELNECRSLCV